MNLNEHAVDISPVPRPVDEVRLNSESVSRAEEIRSLGRVDVKFASLQNVELLAVVTMWPRMVPRRSFGNHQA